MDSNKEQSSVKSAVDWKVFEIQSFLSSDDAAEDDLNEAQRWLSPENFDEVIEDRSAMDLCGFPGCSNKVDSHEENRNKSKSIHGRASSDPRRPTLFCSKSCCDKAIAFRDNLDATPPVLRPIAQSIDLETVKSPFTEISAEEEAALAKEQMIQEQLEANAKEKEGRNPPAFFNPSLSSSGRFKVKLIGGQTRMVQQSIGPRNQGRNVTNMFNSNSNGVSNTTSNNISNNNIYIGSTYQSDQSASAQRAAKPKQSKVTGIKSMINENENNRNNINQSIADSSEPKESISATLQRLGARDAKERKDRKESKDEGVNLPEISKLKQVNKMKQDIQMDTTSTMTITSTNSALRPRGPPPGEWNSPPRNQETLMKVREDKKSSPSSIHPKNSGNASSTSDSSIAETPQVSQFMSKFGVRNANHPAMQATFHGVAAPPPAHPISSEALLPNSEADAKSPLKRPTQVSDNRSVPSTRALPPNSLVASSAIENEIGNKQNEKTSVQSIGGAQNSHNNKNINNITASEAVKGMEAESVDSQHKGKGLHKHLHKHHNNSNISKDEVVDIGNGLEVIPVKEFDADDIDAFEALTNATDTDTDSVTVSRASSSSNLNLNNNNNISNNKSFSFSWKEPSDSGRINLASFRYTMRSNMDLVGNIEEEVVEEELDTSMEDDKIQEFMTVTSIPVKFKPSRVTTLQWNKPSLGGRSGGNGGVIDYGVYFPTSEVIPEDNAIDNGTSDDENNDIDNDDGEEDLKEIDENII